MPVAEGEVGTNLCGESLPEQVAIRERTGGGPELAPGAESFQPQAVFALGWTLGGGAELGADVNVTSLDAGDERMTEVAGGATLSYSPGERLGSYVELYAFAPADEPDAGYFDGGFTYLLSNDFQLDASGGVGLTDAAQDFFVGFGASRRW